MFKIATIRFFIYALPAFMIAYCEGHLGRLPVDESTESKIKVWFFGISTFITAIIFPIEYERQRRKMKAQSAIILSTISSLRKSVNRDLSILFNKDDLYLNIRIFLPKSGWRNHIRRIFGGIVFYDMYNFPGLYLKDNEVSDLSFQVKPIEKAQGLIGQCCERKDITYDFELKKNHKNPYYNLNDVQIQKTDNCEFAIAAPIFDKKNNIHLIISYDSTVKVLEPPNRKWVEVIKDANKTIHLCKPLITHKNINYENSD